MSDIVERLQSEAPVDEWPWPRELLGEAAAEIARLRAENTRLKEAFDDNWPLGESYGR